MSIKVGQQLRQARQSRSLTLEEISQATHIRVHYLRAMESGVFDAIPSTVQARGFLRAYASYLSLDSDLLLAELESGPFVPAVELPTQDQDETSTDPSSAPTIKLGLQEMDPGKAYFVEVGAQLKRQRELLGLSLEDVERHTHLRLHYLLALEAGDLEALPSPVQGRGMLSNYADFLGIDKESLMLKFAEGLQAQLAMRQAAQPQKKRPAPSRREPRPPSSLRRLFSGDFLIGIALASFLLVFVAWGSIRIFAMTAEQPPSPTAPSIADVLLASPTPTESPTPQPATAVAPDTAPLPPVLLSTDSESGLPLLPDNEGNVQLYITIQQRAWLRVVVDGEVELEGRVIPGSAYPFTGESQIEILTGNGAALQVFYNQQDLGNMGTYGEVVNLVFTVDGIFAPTPTVTLTPTATSLATQTPQATASPGPGQATSPANP